jgi:GTP-binding protein
VATDAGQLDFPILYASARLGYAVADLNAPPFDMEPLFEAILHQIPPPSSDAEAPLQLLVAALDYDNHLGQIAIGRISRGSLSVGEPVVRIDREGQQSPYKVERLYLFQGLERRPVQQAAAGEIVVIAGIEQVAIGDTIASSQHPEALPTIIVDEPTVSITLGVNTSPFAGQVGRSSLSRQLHARLLRELQTNVSLRVENTDSADEFLVVGRGELHLAILIETMRREGYEFQVSKPEAVLKARDGVTLEPYELLTIDTREEFIGTLAENLAARLAKMTDMRYDGQGGVRLEFKLPTRGLIGFHGHFLRVIHGSGVMSSQFLDYEPLKGDVRSSRSGALVASETGVAVTYGLNNAQGRGSTFVDPGTPVYEGMIVGLQTREDDMVVNVCREKKLTNMRSSTSDIAIRLTATVVMSLEECLDFINPDELVEVTPTSLRLRKKVLPNDERYRQGRHRKVRVEA